MDASGKKTIVPAPASPDVRRPRASRSLLSYAGSPGRATKKVYRDDRVIMTGMVIMDSVVVIATTRDARSES